MADPKTIMDVSKVSIPAVSAIGLAIFVWQAATRYQADLEDLRSEVATQEDLGSVQSSVSALQEDLGNLERRVLVIETKAELRAMSVDVSED